MNSKTGDHPDVLAHVSVRARNLKVLLCVVFEESIVMELLQLSGKHVILNVESSNSVTFKEESPNFALSRKGSSTLILKTAREHADTIRIPPDVESAVIELKDFSAERMGAKSNNLKIL